LILSLVVVAGGLIELAGITTVAQMMRLVASGGETAGNGPLGWLFQALTLQTPSERLKSGLLITLLVLAGVHGYTALKSYLRSQFVWIQDKEISVRLFSATLQRPYSWFLMRNSAELQHLLMSGQSIQRLLGNVLSALSHLAVAITLTLALLWTDPKVALFGGLVVTAAYGAVRWGTHRMLGVHGAQAHESERDRRKIAQETLTSVRFVKTTGRERFFVDRFAGLSETASKGMVYHGIYVDLVRSFLEWVSFAGILGLSVYLVLKTHDFEQLLPRLTLFTMASYRVIPAIHELFGLFTRLSFDQKYLEEIDELLTGPTLDDAVAAKPIAGLTEGGPLLSLENVDFRYQGSDRDILSGLNLRVHRREWVGVVGTTGAGKSTLLDIMSGLCLPTSGTVRVGTTVLSPEYTTDWQRHLAVVPQEVILLDDTLRRNVAFGLEDGDIDSDRVEKVCQAAGLASLLSTLPAGYDSPLGERGLRLSGGERQRVGLARALYLQPQLMLLDEATSALDQATEARIVATLRDLVTSCTLVTVAHRLSSVKPCDRILVMEHGRIVDQGTYDELIEKSPVFRDLALVGR
jgi:ABC-type multidrug transport system fused ATPase/permease subunit